jgi:hypothetical protein
MAEALTQASVLLKTLITGELSKSYEILNLLLVLNQQVINQGRQLQKLFKSEHMKDMPEEAKGLFKRLKKHMRKSKRFLANAIETAIKIGDGAVSDADREKLA